LLLSKSNVDVVVTNEVVFTGKVRNIEGFPSSGWFKGVVNNESSVSKLLSRSVVLVLTQLTEPIVPIVKEESKKWSKVLTLLLLLE
jgi:hypothetical protein